MKRPVAVFLLFISLNGINGWAQKAPVDYVNPIIGATTADEIAGSDHGLGKTFPGVCTPFGLVQLSPDTKTGGDNGPGYSWHHHTIEGFSFTHMSGIGWYGDLGNFLVMPTTGKLHTFKGTEDEPENGYRSRYSHEREVAKADGYSVMLDDYQIKVELAAASRSGMIRFTYPQSEVSRIQIDLARRIGGTSTEQYVEVVDNYTIKGWMKCTPDGGGWGDGAGQGNYTAYFYCCFDRPLKDFGVWSAEIPDGVERKNASNDDPAYHEYIKNARIIPQQKITQGKHLGFYTEFPTREGEQALLKCGISFVSMEGARKNLQSDIPDWDFDGVRQRARRQWDEALAGVQVEGNEKDKTIFYTSLYHTMIDPRCFSDVDGAYPGADGKVHQADGFVYRTIFSGWDVFRSQFPLQTIINPRLVDDEINSLIQLAELSGKKYFPRWEFLNAYSGCMVGNPAVSVVTDAYNKGIRNYDTQKALEYSLNTVRTFGNNEQGYTPDDLSKTLEYAYTDWCVGALLRSMGKEKEAEEFERKSQSYHQVWCDSVKWFRARSADGGWMPWKGRNVHWQGCIESNNYQQGWFVPHDMEGLIALMGKDYFERELVAFFEGADERFMWGDYYNHPNEPDHQVPFMLNYTSRPWLTQYWTRRICRNAYDDTVNGLCGNEDVGQMSAWYILTAMGFHPICPGNNRYELTSPVFNKVTIALDKRYYKGKTFTIIAHNNSPENVYIQSVSLNGKVLNRLWITHEEIINGGVLEFILGKTPKR
jgi:predicted alpha-1,2-mannosidase